LPTITLWISFLVSVAPLSAVAIESRGSDDRAAAEKPASAKPLGWQEAIRIGLAQHPRVQIAQHAVLASRAVTKQTESANYPRITGVEASSGGNTRVLANLGISGSLPKPTNYLTTPGIRADLLITDFGHTAHRILANEALTASAEKQVLTEKALVILNVEQAYLNCLKQQRLVEIARAVLKERERIRDLIESFYGHKLRSKLDLDFASVEVNRAELALIRAENGLKVAFAALNNAMGLQDQDEYALEESALSITPSEPLDPLFEEALALRPELLGSKDRVRAAEEALKAAKALNYGNITAIGLAGYTYWSRVEIVSAKGNPNNPGAQLGWYGAGGTSAFPLFTGGRIEGQVDEAGARKGESEAHTRVVANDIVLQVAQAYLSRLTAEQQIAVAKEKVAHAREALTLSEARYKVGLGSILEVTTATADLLGAQVGLAEAEYEYVASDAALAYATGREVARY
jgi:outer membrane protein